jgi:uncharacterized membrane protein
MINDIFSFSFEYVIIAAIFTCLLTTFNGELADNKKTKLDKWIFTTLSFQAILSLYTFFAGLKINQTVDKINWIKGIDLKLYLLKNYSGYALIGMGAICGSACIGMFYEIYKNNKPRILK